jgi:hypothetical protein
MSNTLQTHISAGLKSILGIQILIRLDPDHFSQIRMLERAIAVHCPIFQPCCQIRIRVIENPPDLRTMIYIRTNALLYMNRRLETSVAEPEPQGAASFGRIRSRNAIRLRLRRLRLRQWYLKWLGIEK